VSNRLQSDREPALSLRAAASQNQVPVSFAVPAAGRSRGGCSGRSLATGNSLLATAVPQEMDRRIRSMLAAGLAARRIHRQLRLRHYGISVRAIGRYCRQLSAAGSLQAERLEHRASRPHAEDATPTQRLTGHPSSDNAIAVPSVAVDAVSVPGPHHSVLSTQDSVLNTPVPQHSELSTQYSGLSRRILDRLARAIDDPELTPDELTRLANCFARQSHAFERSQAQRIANAR